VTSKTRIIALCWLVFIAAFLFGVRAVEYDLWPYRTIREVQAYIAGDAEESTSIGDKIRNDLNLDPARHLVTAAPEARPDSDYRILDMLPLNGRRQPPRVYLAEDAPRGFRLIYGVIDFSEHLHGAIMLDPAGDVVRVWEISQEGVEWSHPADTNVFPHGLEITHDGSLLVAFDHGTSMTKYDFCGAEQWRLKGGFHHSISLGDNGTFWVLGNEGTPTQFGNIMHEIRVDDGSILRSISIQDMIVANPDIDIFGIRQQDEMDRATWIMTGGGPFHQNDIEPLRKELAPYYPQFEAGDLLVSMRSPDLVFVLAPDNLKVKWWRQGLTRRQHDPDWNRRGTITILNNNMHRGHSDIVELDPKSMESRILLGGSRYHLYTWHRGKHQQLPQGHLLVTSAAQGRVLEVSPDGTVTFDFQNTINPEGDALALSEARFLPLDFFSELPTCAP